MSPEQTIQAHADLGASKMIPMHWGAFSLAFHSWTDPVERALTAGKKTKARILTPKIGESLPFISGTKFQNRWWRQLE